MVKKAEEIETINNNELSYDTKTLLTVILLVTAYPVGLILMFAWMKWSKWIKFLVVLPVLLMLLIPLTIISVLLMVAIKLVMQPESIKTFDTIRNEVRKEMLISPTEMVTPTGMIKKI